MNAIRKSLHPSSNIGFAGSPGSEQWEKAMEALECDMGTHARPGLTWREVYAHTPAVDVYRRNPTRPPAALPEGAALKRAREIAHTKMVLARNAYESTVSDYESLGGNRDDPEA